MGRRENQREYHRSNKGKFAGKKYRNSVLGIDSRIRYLEKKRDQVRLTKTLLSRRYDVEEMYYAIKNEFPDHTDKMIFDIMRSYPSKLRDQPSTEEFIGRRGIIIPVTGTFPEYYEEGYE